MERRQQTKGISEQQKLEEAKEEEEEGY